MPGAAAAAHAAGPAFPRAPRAARPFLRFPLECGHGRDSRRGHARRAPRHLGARTALFGRNAAHTAGFVCAYGPPIRSMQYGTAAKNARHLDLAVGAAQPFERFLDRFRLAGQIHDQRRVIRGFANHRDLPRQDRGRHEVQADLPHLLAEARHFLGRHRERRLRRHVAARGARAARRQHEIAAERVDELDERRRDRRRVVLDEPRLGAPRRHERRGEPFGERRNALVLVDAAACAIADRHEADHEFVGVITLRRRHRRHPVKGRARRSPSRSPS